MKSLYKYTVPIYAVATNEEDANKIMQEFLAKHFDITDMSQQLIINPEEIPYKDGKKTN